VGIAVGAPGNRRPYRDPLVPSSSAKHWTQPFGIHYHHAIVSSDMIERDFIPGLVTFDTPWRVLNREIHGVKIIPAMRAFMEWLSSPMRTGLTT
jgi:hypothetical protein